jgi:hypothetical protein
MLLFVGVALSTLFNENREEEKDVFYKEPLSFSEMREPPHPNGCYQ